MSARTLAPARLAASLKLYGNHRGVDAAGAQRLGDRRGVAEDAHLEIVLIGIDAEVIQGDHRLQPKAAADALHAESFAAQIFQGANLFARDQLAGNFCHGGGDTLEAHAAGAGAERVGRRAVIVLHLARSQGRHAERAVAQLHHADVESIFSEGAALDADPHGSGGFILAGVGDQDRRQRLRVGGERNEEQKTHHEGTKDTKVSDGCFHI